MKSKTKRKNSNCIHKDDQIEADSERINGAVANTESISSREARFAYLVGIYSQVKVTDEAGHELAVSKVRMLVQNSQTGVTVVVAVRAVAEA